MWVGNKNEPPQSGSEFKWIKRDVTRGTHELIDNGYLLYNVGKIKITYEALHVSKMKIYSSHR